PREGAGAPARGAQGAARQGLVRGPARRPSGARSFVPAASIALSLGWAALSASPAAAQSPSFVASLDREAAAPGEAFVYEVTLSVGNDDVQSFRPPDFHGLTVVSAPSAPNRSMSMQMGAGGTRVENRLTWRFELALPAGAKSTVTIGAARARVGGR